MPQPLSEQARNILALIAQGHGYDAILQRLPNCTLRDIMAAAQEALNKTVDEPAQVHSFPAPSNVAKTNERAERYARNYEAWSAEEDKDLQRMVAMGVAPLEIGRRLRRRPRKVLERLATLSIDPATAASSARPVAPARSGAPWTPEEEVQLEQSFRQGIPFEEIAQQHQRKIGGIVSRLIKMGLIQPDGPNAVEG